MVDNCAVERLGGGRETPCDATIAVARASIAARMIVGQNDSSALMESCVGEDLADREFLADLIAFVI